MNFKSGKYIGEISLIAMALFAGFLMFNTGQSQEERISFEKMPSEVFVENCPGYEPLFTYRGKRRLPPNPFLMEKEKISTRLPRPSGLELEGIIQKDEEFLVIIKSEEGIHLGKKGDLFGEWEITKIQQGYIILRTNLDRSFFYLPLRGE